jgi:AsmA family protein
LSVRRSGDAARSPWRVLKGWSRRQRVAFVAAAALLALAAGIVAFHGALLRPLIQHHVQERSGRRIEFEALRLGLDRSGQPTVRLRQLVVQNAAWAAVPSRPLVRAGELGMTFAWRSLFGERVIVTRFELVDADVDLQRHADGRRNWRLTHPDDRGPGHVRVLALVSRNTRMHVLDPTHALEVDLQSSPLTAPVTLAAYPELPLTQRVIASGTRGGAAFEGEWLVSERITLFDTDQPFALRGSVSAGAARAAVEGRVVDLLQAGRLDLELQLAGSRLASLGDLLGVPARWPVVATDLNATLHKAGDDWRFDAVHGRVGSSDLAGSATLSRRPPAKGRSTLRLALAGAHLDLTDLRTAPVRTQPAAEIQPDTETDTRDTARFDADFDLRFARVDGLPLGHATAFAAQAVLRDDRWMIDLPTFGWLGGKVSAQVHVDAARAPFAVAVDARLQNLALASLAERLPQLKAVTGGLDARIALRGNGDSPTRWLAGAEGNVRAELIGATIPESLDAKLGLDGGHLLRAMFKGEDRARIECSALELQFSAGRAQVRRLALTTASVQVDGRGAIDFKRDAIDLVLTPHRKRSALFALDRVLQVSGAIKSPTVALVDGDTGPSAVGCISGSAH